MQYNKFTEAIIKNGLLLMNLTHRNNRDHLAPVNSNISHPTVHASLDKDINNVHNKSEWDKKIINLEQIIQNMTYQNQSMNAMIRTKNQQITNLKNQLKAQTQVTVIQQPKSTIRQVYHLNGFQPSLNQPSTLNSVQLDKAMYQIRVLTKQRDDLLKRCEQVQQHLKGNFPKQLINVPTVVIPQDSISRQQHIRAIQQYEEHIAVMASKLSTVHKLQTELLQMSQQKTAFMNDFQAMRGQLMNRIGYCEHLENQLRYLEQELNNRGPNMGGPELQNALNRNASLQFEINKLNKLIQQKDEKIISIQVNNSGYVQVTKQAFQSMQNNAAALQQKLNLATDSQKKQAEKAVNLQTQINKLNKEFSEKLLKAQNESDKIKKLQHEKAELTSNFARTKLQMKSLQKKFYDIEFELQKSKAQNIKLKNSSALSQQCATELQTYKKKYAEADEQIRKFNEIISKMESKYRQMVRDNERALELSQEGKKKWKSYDKLFKENAENIFQLNEKLIKRTEELETSIKFCVNLQTKLRQISLKSDPLKEEIDSLIQENTFQRN